jgi:hypothetical protein
MISMSRTASVNDICLTQKFHFVLVEIALVPSCFTARKQIIITTVCQELDLHSYEWGVT